LTEYGLSDETFAGVFEKNADRVLIFYREDAAERNAWFWLIYSVSAPPDFVVKLQSTDSPAVLPGNLTANQIIKNTGSIR
jgi:hypothetical protein